MITAGEFRNGITFEMDGNVFQVIEFQHVKPGQGAAFWKLLGGARSIRNTAIPGTG